SAGTGSTPAFAPLGAPTLPGSARFDPCDPFEKSAMSMEPAMVKGNAAEPGRIKRFLTDKSRMIAYLMLIFSLAGYLGGLHRILELTTHFRVQYLALSGCCLAVSSL